MTLAVQSDAVGAFSTVDVVVKDSGRTRLDVELEHAARIAGTVYDQTDQPVANVRVVFREVRGDDVGEGTTDADGHYECGGLRGGARYELVSLYLAGEPRTRFRILEQPRPVRVRSADGRTEGVDIRVHRSSRRLTGRVLDDAGNPVPDARIDVQAGVRTRFYSWERQPQAVSDSDGLFEVPGPLAATVTVRARSPDGGEGLAVGVSGDARDVDIVVARPGAVAGLVVGFGEPPGVSLVPLERGEAYAAAVVDGAFSFRGVAPGYYAVGAQNGVEGAVVEIEVRAGETSRVELHSGGSGTVRGLAVDLTGTTPIAGARCDVRMTITSMHSLAANVVTAVSGPDGRFTIESAPAGRVEVDCGRPGYYIGSHPVTVPRDGEIELRVRMQPVMPE